MMRIYPVKIECIDDVMDVVFKLETFDECSATLTVDTLICNGSVDELCGRIKDAVNMLELERVKKE